jgi:hypothetical protein
MFGYFVLNFQGLSLVSGAKRKNSASNRHFPMMFSTVFA